MYERAKQFTLVRPKLKRVLGIVFVIVGFFALVTPLTPGGFLFFVGLELLGLRILFFEKLFKRKDQTA